MRRILSLIGLFGFFSSVAVHGATYLGIHAGRAVPAIWLLHVGAIALCFPMVFATRSFKQRGNRKEFWNRFYAPIPKWARYVVKLFFAYAIVNFVIFFLLIGSSRDVVKRDNREYAFKTAIDGETQFIEATEEDYYHHQTKVLRGFSGHWMIFYLLPTVYFWFPRHEDFSQGQNRGLVEKPQDNMPTIW